MDTQKTLIMQDGREAFYDEVLRYKNPYSDESAKFWFQGWDAACEEHRLFTSNQEFTIQVEQLQGDIDRLEQSIIGKKAEIGYLLSSIEEGNFITFSREKIKEALKDIISRG